MKLFLESRGLFLPNLVNLDFVGLSEVVLLMPELGFILFFFFLSRSCLPFIFIYFINVQNDVFNVNLYFH